MEVLYSICQEYYIVVSLFFSVYPYIIFHGIRKVNVKMLPKMLAHVVIHSSAPAEETGWAGWPRDEF